MMGIDSAEELQAGSAEVINPHPLQILSVPLTPHSPKWGKPQFRAFSCSWETLCAWDQRDGTTAGKGNQNSQHEQMLDLRAQVSTAAALWELQAWSQHPHCWSADVDLRHCPSWWQCVWQSYTPKEQADPTLQPWFVIPWNYSLEP